MKKALLILLILPLKIVALVDWPQIIDAITADSSHLAQIEGGASNMNYRLSLEGADYFVRFPPPTTQAFYSDLRTEAEVLQALGTLGVSPKSVYYHPDKQILVTEFISHDPGEIDLLDQETRRSVLGLLRKIENSGIHIARTFHPYEDVMRLLDTISPLSNAPCFPEEFYEFFLPTLKHIDFSLSQNQKKTLCHFDLHHRNLLKNSDRLWIVDWEYATMSHPFLVLASMASIERWNDAQMRALLSDYIDSPSEEEWTCLYLYRIAIDLFWAAWNHLQLLRSPLGNPYEEWKRLFYEAAAERIYVLNSSHKL